MPRHSIAGIARWHGTGRDGLYAAAGCRLQAALGPGWRGRVVLVAYGRRAVEVRLTDSIGRRHGRCSRTLIDLSDEAFRALARLSVGRLSVVVGY